MRPALLLALLPGAAAAQPKPLPGQLPPAEKAQREKDVRAALPKLEADYLAAVAAAKADLAAAKPADRDEAVRRFHQAITGDSALAPVARAFTDLRDLRYEYDAAGKWKRPVSAESQAAGLEYAHWVDRHVWGNVLDPGPFAAVDRGYLKKPKIKLAMCGDSVTEYMDPAATMLDHLDGRFEVLDCGLAGHTLTNWFTSPASDAVRRWGPDVVVVMLGTNATGQAMREKATKPSDKDRDALAKQFAADLQALRDLPGKPQVVVASVPDQGMAMGRHAVPAMWALQARVAREHRFPFVDVTRGLAGLMTDVPTAWSHAPNRNAVGKWSHAYDDAHCSYGPATAKYYGLVCRQLLEPERWYALTVRCSATDDPEWKEPWLIAQCVRDPAASKDRAAGVQQARDGDRWAFGPHPKAIPRPTANGEVSFVRPKAGGEFYLMPGRTHTLSFGRPYQIASDTPPADGFPARYGLSGAVVRGDGKPAVGVAVSLGDRATKTDAAGAFRFDGLTGNPVDAPLVVRELP